MKRLWLAVCLTSCGNLESDPPDYDFRTGVYGFRVLGDVDGDELDYLAGRLFAELRTEGLQKTSYWEFTDGFVPCFGGLCWGYGILGGSYHRVWIYNWSDCLADSSFLHELLHLVLFERHRDGDAGHARAEWDEVLPAVEALTRSECTVTTQTVERPRRLTRLPPALGSAVTNQQPAHQPQAQPAPEAPTSGDTQRRPCRLLEYP